MKSRLLITALLATALSFSAQARTYKLATNTPSDSPTGQVIKEFVDAVKTGTDNRVNIRVYWNGALGGQTQYISQVQSGVIDMGMLNSGMLENLQPAIGVINLPYIFRDLEEYHKVMSSDYMHNELLATTQKNGFEVLGYISNGFRSLHASKPIYSIEDIRGLKIRTMASDTYIRMIQAMGAIPVPLEFTETYGALQQGMVDGAEGSLAGLWEIKFGEVTKYGVRSEQTRLTDFIVLSQRAIKTISDEDMGVLRTAMHAASEHSINLIDATHKKSEKLAEEKMGVVITDIDKAPLIEVMKPLWRDAMQDPDKREALERIFAIEDRELDV
ncbi:TRAP transporter substrate-binding protein DctP [Mangrovibacter yixingensis]|uniref:TRAP transporter substrate-binding protein DctP n=1 Tax=Mangrovibacter yixingensis TaxID=1529639 RepID=UPI001CFA15F9|nr:TRAP transporter substrate-binding protein DctP [Mangrovibacter yixingensis]